MDDSTSKDNRPLAAIGHVSFRTSKLQESTEFFIKLGLRAIHESETFAILELRGGTHLVVRQAEERVVQGTNAPFDLMVDDVEVARNQVRDAGMEPSPIEQGDIHKWFTLIEPNGYELTEPPREYRRLISLSQAALANSCSC